MTKVELEAYNKKWDADRARDIEESSCKNCGLFGIYYTWDGEEHLPKKCAGCHMGKGTNVALYQMDKKNQRRVAIQKQKATSSGEA